MKDSITLTKKAFERWWGQPIFEIRDEQWTKLVAESEKPDLAEAWAVKGSQIGSEMCFFANKDAADKFAESYNGTVVLLREVVVDEK